MSKSSNLRRHDLDALRASAMLLGIGFHIAHSLAIGFPWFVQDSQQNKSLLIFMYWVHGFRMPLFFILSGFFTAMLWRQRGLGTMFAHRCRRILLPLILMCVTLVPVTNWTIGYAFKVSSLPKTEQPTVPPDLEVHDLWSALSRGGKEDVKHYLTANNAISVLHPEWGTTPLSVAALFGNADAVQLLIEAGADVSQKNRDGSTALHSAAFMGRIAIVEMLLEAGGDPNLKNARGETAIAGAQASWEVTSWVSNQLSIPVVREKVENGRKEVIATLSTRSAGGPELNLWRAIESHSVDQLKKLINSDVDLGALHDESGMTALAYAAIRGEAPMLSLLLDSGADVNLKNRDGRTALHGAAFLGQAEAVSILIDAGIEVDARGPDRDTAADSAQASIEFAEYVTAQMQIELSREKIQEGRHKVLSLLAEVGLQPSGRSPIQSLAALISFSSFVHLWFLWYLCWLAAGFAIYALAARIIQWRRVPLLWLSSPLAILFWVGITMWPQYHMGKQFDFFGPDTSSELIPRWDILAYYAIFFLFGALYYDAQDKEGRLGQHWPWALGFGMACLFPLGLAASGLALPLLTNWIPESVRWTIGVFCKAGFAWAMSIGFMGLFRRLLTRERPSIRYMSDSSYWLYIIHFPVVILVQIWMKPWPLPALVKFAAASIVISFFLVFTYHVFVRYTPVGWMLNGKRSRRIEHHKNEQPEA